MEISQAHVCWHTAPMGSEPLCAVSCHGAVSSFLLLIRQPDLSAIFFFSFFWLKSTNPKILDLLLHFQLGFISERVFTRRRCKSSLPLSTVAQRLPILNSRLLSSTFGVCAQVGGAWGLPFRTSSWETLFVLLLLTAIDRLRKRKTHSVVSVAALLPCFWCLQSALCHVFELVLVRTLPVQIYFL